MQHLDGLEIIFLKEEMKNCTYALIGFLFLFFWGGGVKREMRMHGNGWEMESVSLKHVAVVVSSVT
jgi:hypothetical protein